MREWAMMSDFSISLPDRPGELARLAARFRAADINLIGLWGYGSGGPSKHARFYCVPESAEQFRGFIESAELDAEEGTTFYITGVNEVGALVKTLEAIAGAGINLLAIQCTAYNGQFGSFVWADPKDWEKLARVLDAA